MKLDTGIRYREAGSEVGDLRKTSWRAGTGERAGVAHLAACALARRSRISRAARKTDTVEARNEKHRGQWMHAMHACANGSEDSECVQRMVLCSAGGPSHLVVVKET